jgi:phosphoserine phosphatase
MKLIVFDMDGVIFQNLDVWTMLHKVYGTEKENEILFKKYYETNYKKLVEEVVGKLWNNKPASLFFNLINKQEYVKGAKETFEELKKRGYKTAIISSGPKQLAERAKKDLGIDYIYANELPIKDGKVKGEKYEDFITVGHNKSRILRELCHTHNIMLKDVIIMGHDKNDIKMARSAGIAIAFCPLDEEFTKYCKHIITKKDLKEILSYIH